LEDVNGKGYTFKNFLQKRMGAHNINLAKNFMGYTCSIGASNYCRLTALAVLVHAIQNRKEGRNTKSV
jgi:hypothetical protein